MDCWNTSFIGLLELAFIRKLKSFFSSVYIQKHRNETEQCAVIVYCRRLLQLYGVG